MVFQFHRDSVQQFEQQRLVTREAIIPFIEPVLPIQDGIPVLDIGCGEGGTLKSLIERGCHGTGVEISEQRLAKAEHLLQDDLQEGRAVLIRGDIFDIAAERDYKGRFQIIFLKDVIEHLPNQEQLLRQLGGMLQSGGILFISFPPWHMPFGGHQQICSSKILSLFPYLHLLPVAAYRAVLKLFNEPAWKVEELLGIKQTGISLKNFERLARKSGYRIIKRELFFINPIYRYKFGLKPRRQNRIITALPYLRDFLTTGCYYLLGPKEL